MIQWDPKWEGLGLPRTYRTATREIWRDGLAGFGGLVSVSERGRKWPEILSVIWGRGQGVSYWVGVEQ